MTVSSIEGIIAVVCGVERIRKEFLGGPAPSPQTSCGVAVVSAVILTIVPQHGVRSRGRC